MPSNPLRKAAKYLREHEWITDDLYVGSHSNPIGVCALGALYYGNGWTGTGFDSFIGREEIKNAEVLLESIVLRRTAASGIPEWNDELAKDSDEVIEMFKFAAEEWDQLHQKGTK